MRNTKVLLVLYAVAIFLAIWSGGEKYLEITAGAAALIAIWQTLQAIHRSPNNLRNKNSSLDTLSREVKALHEQIEFMQRDTSAARTAVRVEELVERIAQIELRLSAPLADARPNEREPKDKATKESSAFVGWPRGASDKKKSVKKRKEKNTYVAVPVGKTYLEVSDILYLVEDTSKTYCAECHRSGKKKMSEVYLREDGAAYICDKCDTWIPTDPQDQAARAKTLKQALQTAKNKS